MYVWVCEQQSVGATTGLVENRREGERKRGAQGLSVWVST